MVLIEAAALEKSLITQSIDLARRLSPRREILPRLISRDLLTPQAIAKVISINNKNL